MNRSGWILLGCFVLSACQAYTPASPYATTGVPHPIIVTGAQAPNTVGVATRTVVSGEPVHIGFVTELNPDCTPAGSTTIRVKARPAHGELVIQDAYDYPNFPPGNQRYNCNLKKTLGREIIYRSVAGYTGEDTATIEAITSRGLDQERILRLVVK